MPDFAEFEMPDGRLVFIRRDAVVSVYDTTTAASVAGWLDVATVSTSSAAMQVPYTASRVMEILYGG